MEHNCVTRSPTPRFVPSCWRYSAVSIRSVDAGGDSKKSRVTLLRWKSIGGSETVLQTLDAVLGIHVTGALHRPNVIVLDRPVLGTLPVLPVDQFAVPSAGRGARQGRAARMSGEERQLSKRGYCSVGLGDPDPSVGQLGATRPAEGVTPEGMHAARY
jgi:hypothetical protein